ncbi:hypothetical protein ABZ519_38380 [Streptomyces collinus]
MGGRHCLRARARAEFLFWVFFASAVVALAAGLWHALRVPESLLR